MRRDFLRRACAAMHDQALQEALERNQQRRMAAWASARADLPNADQLQQQAHQTRLQTIRSLDRHLQQFAHKLNQNGWVLHRAADAAEACDIVLDIIRSHDATLVAKSKSMVSEEIDLNHALEKAGIRVVETDLGEFIVQLRGEMSAHLTAPAVHLRREEVGETFARELGIPYTTEVETLTDAARGQLRRAFLEAPIGFSGVNFGVAESGAICLVTNEGNGRMVTTLPPVHIALMGAERLVPTLEDLALMLKLLPRAGTGQKLTSYVTLIQGPRQAGDPDGPEQRHLILLDNGRLRLAQGPQAEALLCIRCGACLNACPIYREIGGHAYQSVYSGPIGSVISPELFGIRRFGHLAKSSTLCAACLEDCPMRIDLPKLLLRARHDYVQRVRQPATMTVAMRLYAWLMTSPRRYRSAQRLGALFTGLLPRKNAWVRTLPPPLGLWTRSRHFPRLAPQPFRDRWRRIAGLTVTPRPKPATAPAPRVEQTEPRPPVDPVTRFTDELRSNGGEVIRCSREQLPERVAARLHDLGAKHLLTWGSQGPILERLLASLAQNGFMLVQPVLPDGDPEARRQMLPELDRADAGLTGAAAAFADTGTLVLPSGPGRSALASLLPSIHLAVLREADLYQGFEDWLASGGKEALLDASSVALVSGPSRTADIEMTLTIGVHGPGEVIVFVVP